MEKMKKERERIEKEIQKKIKKEDKRIKKSARVRIEDFVAKPHPPIKLVSAAY